MILQCLKEMFSNMCAIIFTNHHPNIHSEKFSFKFQIHIAKFTSRFLINCSGEWICISLISRSCYLSLDAYENTVAGNSFSPTELILK